MNSLKHLVNVGLMSLIVLVFMATAKAQTGLLPQGLYDSCSLSSSACLSRLDTMGQAGFKLVINYQGCGGGSAQTVYANLAQQDGMKVIWDFSGCQGTSDSTIQQEVNIVKNHPATWGYYIGDENPSREARRVQHISNTIHAADPNHPRLMVHMNSAKNLIPFVNSAEVLALDYYPIGDYSGQKAADETGKVAAGLQSLADQNGKQSGMVLQAFSWQDYLDEYSPLHPRYPTREEMRMMRDAVIANSKPALILWYSYSNLTKTAPATFWPDLVGAALGQ